MIGEAAMLPWLSAEEIADLCEGLTQPAAQARFLAKLGIEAKRKPSGALLVFRHQVEQQQAREPPKPRAGPNRAALVALVGGKA